MKLLDLVDAVSDAVLSLFEKREKAEKINTWDEKFPKLPVLVLGIEVRDWELDEQNDSSIVNHRFRGDRKWYLIDHQTAGLGCHHPKILGTVLKVSKETLEKFEKLHKRYYNTSIGCMGCSLDELNRYNNDLKELFDADCETTYRTLEEAIYPIDLCHINKLTTENISSDTKELDKFVEWDGVLDKLCGCCGRWKLWILANNSD